METIAFLGLGQMGAPIAERLIDSGFKVRVFDPRAEAMAPLVAVTHSRLILEEGSATSHVTIVARGLEIPLITRCSRALSLIEPLDPLIIDGANGQVFFRPSEDIVESYNRSSQLTAERRRLYSEVRDLPVAVMRKATPRA